MAAVSMAAIAATSMAHDYGRWWQLPPSLMSTQCREEAIPATFPHAVSINTESTATFTAHDCSGTPHYTCPRRLP
ncbi:hypothetical protein GUJ93_ZPchr0009g936 [Zizania palustris]|uniref:Uncharacterized protein n=1 Tax=Zizania palustris TaxID=103762 RepID=A0A8J5UXI0_ZIZPA|nr:hypothetical protein GUJ93_ZPchr0009g936 [Zizania palustris]